MLVSSVSSPAQVASATLDRVTRSMPRSRRSASAACAMRWMTAAVETAVTGSEMSPRRNRSSWSRPPARAVSAFTTSSAASRISPVACASSGTHASAAASERATSSNATASRSDAAPDWPALSGRTGERTSPIAGSGSRADARRSTAASSGSARGTWKLALAT